MIATRRLAAILAADVAGYSRLIGADEECTLNRLRSIRAEIIDPQITEHRGRIVKTTGDGLLAEFSSVFDACVVRPNSSAAWPNLMPIRPRSAELGFRIGVHQGDIVVSNRWKRFRPHRRLTTCSHGTPRRALLCQGCVKR